MSDDAWVATVWISILLLTIGVFIGGFLVLDNHSSHVSCLRLHEVSGLDTRYVRSGASGECYVHTAEGWVPEGRWRVMED